MDSHSYYSYVNSQDHIIISLNEQIQALFPLKESYVNLQRYHIKTTQDLESLVSEHDKVSEAYSYRMRELLALNEELDNKKTRFMQQIRKIENEKAKLILERKNLMCGCETLGSKFNLENQQNVLLQDRARELIESTKKVEQAVQMYRNIINELQNEIRSKNMEKNELEDEISRKMNFNGKVSKNCELNERNLQKVDCENKHILQQNSKFDQEFNDTQMKIRQSLMRGKKISEECIQAKEELANLYNQKQYYCRLIESQMMIKEDLEISSQKLNHLLQKRTQELHKMNEENEEIRNKIEEEQTKISKNNKYKEAMKIHLNQLIDANSCILEHMEKYCVEDERSHKVLRDKVNRLQVCYEKVRNGEKKQKSGMIFRDKINDCIMQKETRMGKSSGKSWINELKDIQNLSMK